MYMLGHLGRTLPEVHAYTQVGLTPFPEHLSIRLVLNQISVKNLLLKLHLCFNTGSSRNCFQVE